MQLLVNQYILDVSKNFLIHLILAQYRAVKIFTAAMLKLNRPIKAQNKYM